MTSKIIYCHVNFFNLFLQLRIILFFARGNVDSSKIAFNVHFNAAKAFDDEKIVLGTFKVQYFFNVSFYITGATTD